MDMAHFLGCDIYISYLLVSCEYSDCTRVVSPVVSRFLENDDC